MKRRPPDAQTVRIALVLLTIVFILFDCFVVAILESEALIHTGTASGWYTYLLKSISLREFITRTSP